MKKSYLAHISLGLLLSASISFAADDQNRNNLLEQIRNNNLKLKHVEPEDKPKVFGGPWDEIASMTEKYKETSTEQDVDIDGEGSDWDDEETPKVLTLKKKEDSKDLISKEKEEPKVLALEEKKEPEAFVLDESLGDYLVNALKAHRLSFVKDNDDTLDDEPIVSTTKSQEKLENPIWATNDTALEELGIFDASPLKSEEKRETVSPNNSLNPLSTIPDLSVKLEEPTVEEKPKILPYNSGRKLPPHPTHVNEAPPSILIDKTGFPLQSTVSVKDRLKQMNGNIPLVTPQQPMEKKAAPKKIVAPFVQPTKGEEKVSPSVHTTMSEAPLESTISVKNLAKKLGNKIPMLVPQTVEKKAEPKLSTLVTPIELPKSLPLETYKPTFDFPSFEPLFKVEPTIEPYLLTKPFDSKPFDVKIEPLMPNPYEIKSSVESFLMPEPKIDIVPLQPLFPTGHNVEPLTQVNPFKAKESLKPLLMPEPKIDIVPLQPLFPTVHNVEPLIQVNPFIFNHAPIKIEENPVMIAPQSVPPLNIQPLNVNPITPLVVSTPKAPTSAPSIGITYEKKPSGKAVAEYNNGIATGRVFIKVSGNVWHAHLNGKKEKKYTSSELPFKLSLL